MESVAKLKAEAYDLILQRDQLQAQIQRLTQQIQELAQQIYEAEKSN